MAVDGCIKTVPYDTDSDDDKPLTFRRSNFVNSNKSAAQNTLSGKEVSTQAHNGQNISPAKISMGLSSKAQGAKPLSANLSSRASVRSDRSSDHKPSPDSVDKNKGQRPSFEHSSSANARDRKAASSQASLYREATSIIDKGSTSKPSGKAATAQSTKVSASSIKKHEVVADNSKDKKALCHTYSSLTEKGACQPTKRAASSVTEPSSDSDDDKPLNYRFTSETEKGTTQPTKRAASCVTEPSNDTDDLEDKPQSNRFTPKASCKVDYATDSDDDKPLNYRFTSGTEKSTAQPTKRAASSVKEPSDDTGDLEDKPLSYRYTPKASNEVDYATDSDDDKPLNYRFTSKTAKSTTPQSTTVSRFSVKEVKEDADDLEDKKPLSLSSMPKSVGGTSLREKCVVKKEMNGDFQPSKNLTKRPFDADVHESVIAKKPKISDASTSSKAKLGVQVKQQVESEDSDDVPIAQRLKKGESSSKKTSTKILAKKKTLSVNKDGKKFKKSVKSSQFSKTLKVPPGSGGGQKWTTLEHNGVVFPPPYKPHGVKMLYNGQPVDLTPEQEEVATMFAVMKDTEYAGKPTFIENFFNDWRQVLGRNHIIKKFDLCDFNPIYEWHMQEKEKKKQLTTEEKKALREEKLKLEEKYMWAIVDGKKEKVGNFRVEPPGLFRGRGEHPKMGKLKRRIRPSDITINIGKGAPVPECPIPGERWKEVRHDNTVTWLAFWNDPINKKDFKYVFLAASSSLKGQSDREKYEKSRLLKKYIDNIRKNYTRDFTSKDPTKRQIAVATYLIDKLALRAGNEKDDDEADTVGCCTLKVENVVCEPPNKLNFDFLGKDSIRYKNTVEVELPVYKAIEDFRNGKRSDGKKKGSTDDIFDLLDTSKLNAHLRELMPGLTAKVFRTYNASITLDDILSRETEDEVALLEKIAVYQRANKEVAIICNHQRTVSKSHASQMSRLNEKIEELKAQKEELQTDLNRAKKKLPPLKDKEGKQKRNLSPEALEKKLVQIDEKIEKMEKDKEIKEDLKTVALGTSKINYLDPRITVAWCKRHEVPIEKIFNKSLIAKFSWAMDVDPSFRF